ncbi:hypothetical protein [Cellulomonas sp. URHE0023]|uniref:hypothetical protein n=1 Tax=Cellulomonas sp. URHE0023 TaxID=1380354 RepID=UPI0004843587|nr:hypothetical protein [Cellulomonas sp. URHE0023]
MIGRRPAALTRPLLVRAVALAAVPSIALAALLAGPTATSAQAADTDPVTAAEYAQTKTLTRAHLEPDGSESLVDQRTVTVSVDHTNHLRGRQKIGVSWSGAHPSAARSSSPYGVLGFNSQEYPVVILECRGLDDPSLPAAQQLSPETCWTSNAFQRTQSAPPPVRADPNDRAWVHDRYAAESDRAAQQLLPGWPAECNAQAAGGVDHLVPFIDAKGKVWPACDTATMPADASGEGGALPPAEVAVYTAPDGTGNWQFEVRSTQETESLGCSSSVRCSLVVIPIMGISCEGTNAGCRASGTSMPGSTWDKQTDPTVGANLWWSESNWRGRFSVPLTFGLTADACDVLDSRPPVDFWGSELIAQASLQWAPAYCLRADRFKFRGNAKSESSSVRLVDSGQGVAAFVSYPAAAAKKQLAYAPVAVTGFGISFVVDQPDNTGERTELKLTARLLAKLLSQSYRVILGSPGHPGMQDNPQSLNRDPEFKELNPGLSETATEARATLLSLSESADTMRALTSYIAADADAMAFLHGTPDPWGMVVNPDFQSSVDANGLVHGLQLPLDEWPLLDTWVLPSQSCMKKITTPYYSLIAAPVNSLRKIATAMIDAWPNAQTKCTDLPDLPVKVSRGDPQNYGSRFMLGVVSLGDAERYGLHLASLQTAGTGTGATFVAPDNASMAAAVAGATSAGPAQAFTLDAATLPDDAYPGTMIVQAAVPTTGLSSADAGHVAQFVTTATTEGQVPGPGNGQLPEGFLPITEFGATAKLFAAAQASAAVIAAQKGIPASTPTTATSTGTTTTSSTLSPGASTGDAAAVGSVTGTGDPSELGGADMVTVDGEPAPSAPASARTTASGVATPATPVSAARIAIPVAAGVGLCGALALPFAFGLGARRPGP